jgi:hypothetical protein
MSPVYFWIFPLIFSAGFWIGCSETESNIETIRIQERSENYTDEWGQFIRDSTRIDLGKSGIQEDFTAISHIVFLSSGELILPNGFTNTIYIIDRDGSLKKRIHKDGRGPGEFRILARVAVDEEDHIYVYDPSQRKIIVYYAPDYNTFDDYYSGEYLSRFTVLDGIENIAVYSPYTEYLFNRVNFKDDELLHSSVIPDDENFKIWMARIQSGGLVYDREHECIYGLYPEKLMIYKFSKDLELKAHIIPDTEELFYKEFPVNLDPYDHTLRHEEWWSEFNHLSRIQLLDGSRIIVSYSGKNQSTSESSGIFINVYDLVENKFLAEGLKLPDGGNIAGSQGNHIFVSFNASVDDDNREIPFQLYMFELNI